MSLTVAHIVVDCANAETLAAFWSTLLERPVDPGGNAFFSTVGLGAPGALMFLQVPEPKQGKNRLHLDLTGPDWQAHVERAVGLGATTLSEHKEYGTQWVTLADPEGNEFDIGAGVEAG